MGSSSLLMFGFYIGRTVVTEWYITLGGYARRPNTVDPVYKIQNGGVQ